jgi:hypothetical protein
LGEVEEHETISQVAVVSLLFSKTSTTTREFTGFAVVEVALIIKCHLSAKNNPKPSTKVKSVL